eukprot:CAMPEP_0196581100 /NCGR_PEP_ID=MMETSP1081-20130531/32395_1 /TAXON_ID=36882 /ORGANISM="Pyramimonas amylifera, Strain CCMP720" /LENGTH=334 /DNA_ID=CAMNT_0041901201 /DNA_START=104 /DNA_END=1105 /DNA_ORIENTATION=+
MAKVGEGDDRWIVQERADGANVHGWHWQEKDCLPWSRVRLEELLGGLVVCAGDSAVWLKVTKVDSVNGEAYVNIRKGKKIPGYEIELKAAWEGEIREGGVEAGAVISKANGTVHLPYIADENADEDPEVKITSAGEGPAFAKMREIMVNKGRALVGAKVKEWRAELHAGGPGGDGPAPVTAPTTTVAGGGGGGPTSTSAFSPAPIKKEPNDSKVSIKLTEKFLCRAVDVFDALTQAQRIMAFTQARAESDPRPGGKFSMFEGSVHGVNVEMVPGQKLVQQWRFTNWPEDCYSTVTITFKEPEPGNTIVALLQTGIPDEDKFGNHNVLDQTEHGW